MATHSSILAQEIPIHGVKKELDTTGQLNNNKDAFILIPGTYDYVMLHGQKKRKEKHFADVIKLRILSKSGYPGLSR